MTHENCLEKTHFLDIFDIISTNQEPGRGYVSCNIYDKGMLRDTA